MTAPPAELSDLAALRVTELRERLDADSTLDAVMRRLFDPAERDLVTVSAFGSAL